MQLVDQKKRKQSGRARASASLFRADRFDVPEFLADVHWHGLHRCGRRDDRSQTGNICCGRSWC